MPLISNRDFPPSSPPIGIYTGSGASHSWLWFVDILDRMGFDNLHFVGERDILSNALDSSNVLLMSGGDTFAIAEGLGAEGSDQLRRFIERGGLYIGTCAGAYLPLRSSMGFLNQFNFVNVKISNISRRLSETERHSLQKVACSAYGCDFVFHVAREDVLLRMANGYFVDGKKEMIAPLYGGPSMLPSEDIEPIATYQGFTQKTKFLVEKELAEKTMVGNIAVAKKSMGEGHLYIFGPHFEHPHYPTCNHFLAEIIRHHPKRRVQAIEKEIPETPVKGEALWNLLTDLKRELSNARILVSGMNDFSTSWLIGNKNYEAEKISVFLHSVWNKLRALESWSDLKMDEMELTGCVALSKKVIEEIKTIQSVMRGQGETTALASQLFINLKALSSHFFALYFKGKRDQFPSYPLGRINE